MGKKVTRVILKSKHERVEFEINHYDKGYTLLLYSKELYIHEVVPISEAQLKRVAKDIEEHLNLQVKLSEFVPTSPQIVDAFQRLYTGSGKLMTIMDILDADPSVKEWVHKTLNGEPLR